MTSYEFPEDQATQMVRLQKENGVISEQVLEIEVILVFLSGSNIATQNVDFIFNSPLFATLSPMEQYKSILIDIQEDDVNEPDEILRLRVQRRNISGNPQLSAALIPTTTITILNDNDNGKHPSSLSLPSPSLSLKKVQSFVKL